MVVFLILLFSNLLLRPVSIAFMQILFFRCLTPFNRRCDFTTLEEFEKYAEMLLVVRSSTTPHSLSIVFIFMSRISCVPLKR
jgi:hypothetical protein